MLLMIVLRTMDNLPYKIIAIELKYCKYAITLKY